MGTKTKYTSSEFYKEFGDLTFGELLRAFRKTENLNQTVFAARLGLSSANLCDLEKGRKIPSPSRAVMIANRLHLPRELLVQLALQDSLRKAGLEYKVSIAA